MIDIKLVRENPELVKENMKKKFQDEKIYMVDEIIKLDKEWRQTRQEADELRSHRNKITLEIQDAKKKKNSKRAESLLSEARKIPEELKKTESKEKEFEQKIKELMYKIPNIMHSSVPIGENDTKNVEVKRVGKPVVPKYEIFNHVELAEKLKGADFETARDISGKGFYFLRGKLALLSAAMLSFARDYMLKKGFEYVEPPMMVKNSVVDGVMSFVEKQAMMYKIENEDLYLIGTAEHPLVGLFMNKTLQKKDLPVKITGFSSCFRKEVGAHGIEEKGFYRVHQFNKQEMIVVCEPEDSYNWYDKLVEYTIEIFQEMNIPIRVLEMCSGDLGDLKAKSCDVEAWSPRQKKYYEVGSLTNMETAQARRLGIKIEGKFERYFAHTLNNTVIATPRALISLMENNQQKDSSIKIPKCLHKYLDFKEIKIEEKKK